MLHANVLETVLNDMKDATILCLYARVNCCIMGMGKRRVDSARSSRRAFERYSLINTSESQKHQMKDEDTGIV